MDKKQITDILKESLGKKVSSAEIDKIADKIYTLVQEASATPRIDWEEVIDFEPQLGFNLNTQVSCDQICFIASEIQKGTQFRLLRKKAE